MGKREIIEIVIRSDGTDVKKDLKEVADEADKAGKAAEGLNVRLKDVAKAGTAAGAAVLAASKYLIDYKNQINDTARATGLASDTIAGLKLAAEGSGLSLESLTAGLRQLPKRLSDAKRGTGEALPGLRALGLEADVLNGRIGTADDLLRAYGERIGGVKNPTEQAAIAVQLFGEAGGNLLVALGDGEGALQAYIDRAEVLGPAFDSGADSAARLQRQLADLSTAGAGAVDRLLGALGFENGLGSLLDGLIEATVYFGRLFAGIIEGVSSALGGFTAKFSAMVDAIKSGDFATAAKIGADLTLSVGPGGVGLMGAVLGGAAFGAMQGNAAGVDAVNTLRATRGQIGTFAGGAASVPATPATTTTAPGAASSGLSIPAGQQYNAGMVRTTTDRFLSVSPPTLAGASPLSPSLSQLAPMLGQGANIGMGLATGNVGAALGALGPAGMAVGALSQIGQMGAGGVREQLRGFTDSIVAGLEALPEILSEVIPEFAQSITDTLIPALIENGPAIFDSLIKAWEAIIMELPDMIAAAVNPLSGDGTGNGLFSNLRQGDVGGFFRTTIARGLGVPGSGSLIGDIAGSGQRSSGRGSAGRSSGGASGARQNVTINVSGVVAADLDDFTRKLDEHLGYGGPGRSAVIGG